MLAIMGMMDMTFANYSLLFKISYVLLIVPTILVIVSALISAKEIGGTLGQGIKKIAAGSVIDASLLMSFLLLERGNMGLLNQAEIRIFFLLGAILGSSFLIAGYIQIYRVNKRLKLFT